MKQHLYFVEVGVLLTKDDTEFDCYTISNFYNDKFGFFDENRLTFLTEAQALKYANDYVNNGVEYTYAFIHDSIENIDEDDLREIVEACYCEYSLENPHKKDIIYFIYKEKGKIIKEIGE